MQGLVHEDIFTATAEGKRMIGLSDTERSLGRETYDFYCFLIWPFIDAAWLGAVSLLALANPSGINGWVDMQKAQDMAQLAGRTLYHQGDLSYFEAVNKEALKNAYSRFQEEGIIEVAKSTDAKPKPVVRIAPEWVPERNASTGELQAFGRLWEFIEKISQYRREGKNRRDEATVSTRILTLAARLNKQLFASEVATEDTPRETRKERRRRSKL
jgi:hypothetical protein